MSKKNKKKQPIPPSIRILKHGVPICVNCHKMVTIVNTHSQLCANCNLK